MSLVIWTNTEFPPAETALLEAGVAPHRLVRARTTSAAVLAAGRPDPLLAEADVAFGQPDAAQCLACPRLRWVEVTTAGYTRYDTAEFREGFRARGATVDENALLEALRSGRVGEAYLDVFQHEPLPPDHPLWEAPNCFITPHTAGGRHDQNEALVHHFLANLEAFTRGGPLKDRVV